MKNKAEIKEYNIILLIENRIILNLNNNKLKT